MSHEINVLQHLIRFVKGTVADIVGREKPGPNHPWRKYVLKAKKD